MIEGPCDANALSLASAEAYSTLTHNSAVTGRHSFDKAMKICNLGRLLDLLVINTRRSHSEGNVGGYAVVSEKNVLRHITDPVPPGFYGGVIEWLAVNKDSAFSRLVQSKQDIYECSFT